MAKQRFLNNFTSTFIAAVKDAPSSGTPETELDYGVLRISDGAAGSLINPTDGDYYLLTAFKRSGSVESNIEVMRVTGVNNATPGECRITVQRAQEGTSAKAFVAGDYLSLRITKGTAENFSQPADLATKEPVIAAPVSAPTEKYWRGDKTWRDFFTDVRAATLTGLSTATNAVIAATDTVLSALGKLQKQVSDNLATLTSHTGNTSNPHGVTKVHVGLGNVDNTSDANKPISTATQAALNGKQASLGFTPVQQGGPAGYGTNKVFIGWATNGSGLLCQVDGTDFGKTWPINVAGTAARVANQYVSPAVEQNGDIGAAFVNWTTTATPAVQLDTPNSNAAYMVWRATRLGARHVAAMHVYEGNMTVTMSVGSLNNFTWDGNGNFTANGNVTAYSDIRLKTDLTKIADALGKVCALNGYTYVRKDTGQRQTGVVAQELQEVLPEAVVDNGEHLAVAYGNIVGLLIEAIKELKSEVDQLKGK